MPCNYTGYQVPKTVANWGIVDFDWSNNLAGWSSSTPMNNDARQLVGRDPLAETRPCIRFEARVYNWIYIAVAEPTEVREDAPWWFSWCRAEPFTAWVTFIAAYVGGFILSSLAERGHFVYRLAIFLCCVMLVLVVRMTRSLTRILRQRHTYPTH